MRRPPGFKLLPYTTLFRSPPAARAARRRPNDRLLLGPARAADIQEGADRRAHHEGVDAYEPRALGQRAHARVIANRDRKSTRLNSSHGYISHAVFRLQQHN